MLKKNALILGILIFWLGLIKAVSAAPLTERQVTDYVASVPEGNAIGEKFVDKIKDRIDLRRPLSSALELIDPKGQPYADLKALAKRYNFHSVEEWADVGDRTMTAYRWASATPMSDEEIEAGYQQGRKNIQNDIKLKPKQKETILGKMHKTHLRNQATRKAAQPDLPAVKAHMDVLAPLYE